MTSPSLSSFFDDLLADADITADKVQVVCDNARRPPRDKLKSVRFAKDDTIFAALPSRWDKPRAEAVRPMCLPRRQVSIELPFNDFSDDESSSSSNNNVFQTVADDSETTECSNDSYDSVHMRQSPPPLPPRWSVGKCVQASLKRPERSSPTKVIISLSPQSDSFASLSSLTGTVLSPVELGRNRST